MVLATPYLSIRLSACEFLKIVFLFKLPDVYSGAYLSLVYNTILLPFPKTIPKTYRKPMRRVSVIK